MCAFLDGAVLCIGFLLAAFDSWMTLVYPIGAKIIGQIERLHMSETERLQLLVSLPNIWAATPRTASTVDYDELILFEAGDSFAQGLPSCARASSSNYSEPGTCASA
jgi:hypothetical protein